MIRLREKNNGQTECWWNIIYNTWFEIICNTCNILLCLYFYSYSAVFIPASVFKALLYHLAHTLSLSFQPSTSQNVTDAQTHEEKCEAWRWPVGRDADNTLSLLKVARRLTRAGRDSQRESQFSAVKTRSRLAALNGGDERRLVPDGTRG